MNGDFITTEGRIGQKKNSVAKYRQTIPFKYFKRILPSLKVDNAIQSFISFFMDEVGLIIQSGFKVAVTIQFLKH